MADSKRFIALSMVPMLAEEVAAAINAAGGDIPAIEARVDVLESDVGTLQGEVTTLQSEMTAVEAAVATIPTDATELSMATARILGRTTASTGPVEQLTVGAGLSLAAGSLSSTITQYTDEMARDALGLALTAGANITITPNDGSDTITIAATGLASTTQTAEMIAGFIAAPSDKSYTIALKMAHGGTITETTTKSVSGTCTATFKVNATALGGTANSVSSSEQSQAHSSTNTFVAGDDIVLTVSANSACADMSFSIKYTRVLE